MNITNFNFRQYSTVFYNFSVRERSIELVFIRKNHLKHQEKISLDEVFVTAAYLKYSTAV